MAADLSRESRFAGPVAGIDEAGRGPLAGPVVLDPRRIPEGVADSKVLPRAERERLHDALRACAWIGVGAASVAEIDTLNILAATLLAMQRAAARLPVAPVHALVDGNRPPDLACPAETVIKGDALCLSVAAASIVAKVVRDRIMARLAPLHPGFGWERNAGYATLEHRLALVRLGPTAHHRKSFAPVRRLLAREPAAN
jgi:ribonuclease HII